MKTATTTNVIRGAEVERAEHPDNMGTAALVSAGPEVLTAELTFAPGQGFPFHYHERQREIIYVIEGELETWSDQEKMTLRAGDAIDVPAGGVHATFNVGDRDVKLFIVLTPFLTDEDEGWTMTDVSQDEPYASLR